ncbi:LLM class flavin-dependent oxidoreductase [Streptomyces sp. bgisy027]|uniref:LLM class flavin-dependent oxidoreductase n=1 Tax=unclassified Streptomyces TaxID=2593676 RepID=UPI003D70C1E5
MRLGTVVLWGDDIADFRRQVRLAEDLGYEVIGVGDSPAAWHDMYVSLTVAAQETRTATLATMVTTPFLRHPAVTAGAASALHELTGGRFLLTMGVGGSALASLGRSKAKVAEVGDYMGALRELLNGGRAEVDGFTTAPLRRARALPLYLAADGPRTLRLAGELADGVVIGVGLSLDLVAQKIDVVRAAARDAGRDPDAIDFWGMGFASVRESRAEADHDISAFLASVGGMGLKAPHMRAIIPPELLGAVMELERRYDPTKHVVVGSAQARMVEELGLTDFLVGLRGVTGNPQEVRAYTDELAKLGVSCLLAPMPGNVDPEGMLARVSAALRD